MVELELPARRGARGVNASGDAATFDRVHAALSHGKNNTSNSLAEFWSKLWQNVSVFKCNQTQCLALFSQEFDSSPA
jgi:hypothetical protein